MAVKKVTKKKSKPATVAAPAKKTVKKAGPASKKVTKKPAAKKERAPRKPSALAAGVDFKEGSDMEVAFNTAMEGASTRRAMLDDLRAKFGNATTRRGNSKPVSTILNQVVRRALATGDYTLETSWKLVPVPGKAKPVTTEKPVKTMKKKAGPVKAVKKTVKKKKS